MNKILEKTKPILTKTLNALFVLILIVFSFFIGFYYKDIITLKVKPDFNKVTAFKDISILVNEKNQLMIVDKKNSTFTIYEDSVSNYIFNLKAIKIYNEK